MDEGRRKTKYDPAGRNRKQGNVSVKEGAAQKRREICRRAARLFYEKSFEGASMQEIAQAVGLTKAGLYHYVDSKEQLLYEIMNYGMHILDETVISKVAHLEDPLEKLKQTIAGHIHLIVHARDLETTVILHENRTVRGPLRKKINARKKAYIHYLEDLITQVQGKDDRGKISPRLAAFALLGMINWLYQWYDPSGPVKEEELARTFIQIFLGGLLSPATLAES